MVGDILCRNYKKERIKLKIIFNLVGVGLGNQGGSLTIIKSANILKKLGHEVIIINSGKNQHTWTPLYTKHLIIKAEENIPDADVVIATGFKSWKHTIKLSDRCGKKYVWLRGWEVWNSSEKNIISILSDKNMIKIVNSICLRNKLLSYKIKSHIIRPGNDFEDLFPTNTRQTNNNIILGGLYHIKHKTKRSDWIINITKSLKEKYNNIELHMFGSNKNPNNKIIDKYISQPNIIKKNKFFNNIDIFLSPSSLEGLHIVPQEAMMTGCSVVGTDADMSGTEDYLIDNYNGIISKDDFKSFSTNVEKLIKNEKMRFKFGKNARKTIEELGDRETNMKKLIKYLKGLK